MTLLVPTAPGEGTSSCNRPEPMLLPLQPATDDATTDIAQGASMESPDIPLVSVEAINEGSKFGETSASPLSNLTAMQNAINDAEAEPAVNRATPQPTDRASSLAPGTQIPRYRRSFSQQPPDSHRVEDEQAPDDPFNTQSFQACLTETKDTVAELAKLLGSSALGQTEGSELRRLHLDAVDLENFQHSTTRTIGFVGTSGAGKSSLLNCLLDQKDLDRASNSGKACTCVVTEFHYHESRNCSIEAEFWTDGELMNQLRDLTQAYCQYELSAEKSNGLAKRHKLAEDTFRSMFRGRLFDWDFLTNASEEDILETFQDWISELHPRQSSAEDSDLSLEACAERLACLASDQTSPDSVPLWPYIRKIKVFVRAHILRGGLVLADLPGLGDLNSARCNVTETYLRECKEIFVVCNIGRAASDKSVQIVFGLAKKTTTGPKVGIICTKSDDNKPNEAKRDWPEHAATIDELQHGIDTEKGTLADINRERADITSNTNLTKAEQDAKLIELLREAGLAETELAKLEIELETLLITTRNGKTVDELHSVHKTAAEKGLEIYCVSNMKYWDKRKRDRKEYEPSLNLSGIRELRRYCISTVSATQYQEATEYMLDKVPALVARVLLWVQSGAGETGARRKQNIARVCDALENRLSAGLSDRLPYRLSRALEQHFKDNIYLLQRAPAWEARAKARSRDWRGGMSPGTYAAGCRHDGHWKTGKGEEHNWNEEVIQAMVNELTGPWNAMCTFANNECDIITESIDAQRRESVEYMENELGDSAPQVILLRRVLRPESRILIRRVERAFEKFESKLRKLGDDLLSAIPSAFVGEAMAEAYRQARYKNGTGSHNRKADIIEGAVASQDFIVDMLKRAKERFLKIVDNLAARMLSLLDRYLSRMITDLNLVRKENVVEESETDPDFRRQVEEMALRVNEVMSDVKERISS